MTHVPCRRGGFALPASTLVLLIGLTVASAGTASAQNGGVSVYRYTETGQTAMTVDLLGAVGRPGRYLLNPGLTVLDLIVLSGGSVGSQEGGGENPGVVSVTRTVGGVRSVVYSAPVADVLVGQGVPIEDGDLVLVQAAAPGALKVDVWGSVGRTGRLLIEPPATVLDVIAEAGGPDLGSARADEIRISVSRPVGSGRAVVYEGTLEDLSTSVPPRVESGDIVSVRNDRREGFSWRDGLSIVSSVAALAVLVIRLVDQAPGN